MREYQQRSMKSYVLPEAVYRQALWAVKDLPRLKEILERSLCSEGDLPQTSLVAENGGSSGKTWADKDFTGQSAVERAMTSVKIQGGHKAEADRGSKIQRRFSCQHVEKMAADIHLSCGEKPRVVLKLKTYSIWTCYL